MPGFLLHVGATIECFHKAPVTTAPTQPRVLVSGQPVATALNQLVVAPGACPFTLPTTPPKPQPCVRVLWGMVSARVLINGQFALLQASPGPGVAVCQSVEQIPQGPPAVTTMQLRVSAM